MEPVKCKPCLVVNNSFGVLNKSDQLILHAQLRNIKFYTGWQLLTKNLPRADKVSLIFSPAFWAVSCIVFVLQLRHSQRSNKQRMIRIIHGQIFFFCAGAPGTVVRQIVKIGHSEQVGGPGWKC